MESLAFFALLVLGLLIAIPWAAFSALARAKQAMALVARQQVAIDQLRAEIATLRRSDHDLAMPEPPSLEVAPDAATDVAPDIATAPMAMDQLSEPPTPEPAAEAAEDVTVAPEAAAPDQIAVAARDAVPEQPEIEPAAVGAELPPLAAPAASPAASAPEAGRRDLEESIGSRWAVWVGGVALAFGGLFLVRYSIEAGFFGPGVRLLMGAAFALVAAAASEYVRRTDRTPALGALPAAHIPSVLAGVSVLSGFGVAYAAHAIYGFIGPALAFSLMGLIGLAALAASLVHGPALGLFGLVGSYATPLLVSSSAPSYSALSLFVAVVTGVAFLLHGRRPSRMVTLGAVAGHGAWTCLIGIAEAGAFWSPFLLMIGAVLALVLIKEWSALRARASIGAFDAARLGARFDLTGFTAIAVPLILSGVIWTGFGGPSPMHAAIIVTVLVATIAAVRHADVAPLAPLAAAAAAGMILLWPTQHAAFGLSPRLIIDLIRLSFVGDAAPGIAWTAALFALIVGAAPFHALLARRRPGGGDVIARACLAFASSLGPLCLLLAAAIRINGFNRSLVFAAISLLLVIALFAASELILRVERRSTKSRSNPLAFVGSAAYAAGAAIALGLSIAFALRETWLVVGFAVAAAGVAIVASLRPIPLLRTMSAMLATAALGRLIWQPILTDVGTWPLLNWLIPAYALPALCFAIAALALRDRQDRPRSAHEALSAFFAAAFMLLEVRQFFAGPNLIPTFALIDGHYSDLGRSSLFEEVATHVAAIGFIGFGLQTLHRRMGGRVFGVGADIAAAALLVIAIGGLCALFNPLFDGTAVLGPPVFNRLLAYVLVGGFLGALGFLLDRKRASSRMGEALGASAITLIALGAVLIVRHAFAGPELAPANEDSIGFAETVMMAIVLLALACAARIWREASSGRLIRFALRALTFLAIGWAAVMLGFVRNPMIDLSGVAGPILFNRILWGYGAVAIAFAAASRWMRDAEPATARSFAKTAIGLALLGLFLLLRHSFHGPQLSSDVPITLAEAGWYATMVFVAAIVILVNGSIGLLGRRRTVSAKTAAAASCGPFALLSGVIANPLATEAPLAGPIIFDNAMIGYLIPSVLAYAAARWAREHVASSIARRIFGAAAIIGGLAYLLIEVRRWFVGRDLVVDSFSSAELYAYSAAILLYGVALLALGFKLQSKDLRLASLGVVTIAVCKAFLIDMSGLEGLLRALSFIGLGASLVGVGLAYQRLLLRERKPPAPSNP